MKVYRSRFGWELWLPVMVLLSFPSYSLIKAGLWLPLLILLAVPAFIAIMMLKTQYVIMDDVLIVKCWPIINTEFSIGSIHRIRNTWNPMSSPAASFIGRIEVHYGKGRTCIISPKDKRGFIEDLLSKNKSILTFEAR